MSGTGAANESVCAHISKRVTVAGGSVEEYQTTLAIKLKILGSARSGKFIPADPFVRAALIVFLVSAIALGGAFTYYYVKFGRVIDELRSRFDWILCDSPAGIERGATLAMRYCDEAVIVTNPEVSSVRDSDRIIGMLDSKTVRAEKGERVEKHILITRYDASRAARGEMLTIDDILEILATPLLGIIPESQDVLKASNVGTPVTLSNADGAPARAYIDAARRLCGDSVPMQVPAERRRFMDRLLRRRAA